MLCCAYKMEPFVRIVVGVLVCLSGLRTALGCHCVPERLCPSKDVDLRLVDADDGCPVGMTCCDAPVNDGDSYCDGQCQADQCPGASFDYEYGEDTIDVRSVDNGNGCPANQYCCKTTRPHTSNSCSGTCLPESLCTMFVPSENGGCGQGHVCCHMNRTSWMGLIGDINAMVGPGGHGTDRGGEGSCAWSVEQDGTRVPPWLVSIWARVEIIPGLQTDQFLCGGVLVDPALVLTTATCVKNQTGGELFVNVGDHDLSSRSLLRMENIYAVQEKIVHEYFDSTDSVYNDLALLRLTNPTPSGHCAPRFDSEPPPSSAGNCYLLGWDRERLTTGSSGRPHRTPAEVVIFQQDLFCAPGTICLRQTADDTAPAQNCEGDALRGAVVLCEERGQRTVDGKLRGLLARNCAGVGMEGISSWLDHQRAPGFVQIPTPVDPSRRYLPVL